MKGYRLLDSGYGEKLEDFAGTILRRPCSQALWNPQMSEEEWNSAHGIFSRDGGNCWIRQPRIPQNWQIELQGVRFFLDATDFGHVGLFPEHAYCWDWMIQQIKNRPFERPPRILNLFAYSGGATLALAQAGAELCHVDASKGMIEWARENARLNNLEDAPIRWIVDDVEKFLIRELKRGRCYDGILLDPPSFGRGSQGQVFKISDRILPLLDKVSGLLSDEALFVFLSCHTPGFTPMILERLLADAMWNREGTTGRGELALPGDKDIPSVPSGTFAFWTGGKGNDGA